MPSFDSLSFALLIPFAICFVLIFIVCCFADEIKDICRLPSPLPSSYIGAEHVSSHRRSRRSRERRTRRTNETRDNQDDVQTLILSEEGRSRNVSESSGDYVAQQIVSVIHEQPSTSSGVRINVTQNTDASANHQSSDTQKDIILTAVTTKTPPCSSNFARNISFSSQSAPTSDGNKSKTQCECTQSSNSPVSSNLSTRSDNTSHARTHSLTNTLTSYLSPDVTSTTSLPSTSTDNSQRSNQQTS